MALLEYIHREDAEGSAREMLDRMVEKTGASPLFYEAMAHNPTVVGARADYFSTLMTEGVVDRETKEFVYVVVSLANECEYCVTKHGTIFTERFGNSPAEIETVRAGRLDELPEEKRAVAAFADQVVRDPKRVTERHRDDLLAAGYDEAGVVELLAVAASAVAANTIVDALSVSLEDAPDA